MDFNHKLEATRADGEACQRLISQYRPLLSLVARQHMRQRYRARFDESDVVQVACWEAFQSFGTFRGQTEHEFFAWLETILKRSLAGLHEHHSTQKRDVNRESVAPSMGQNGEENVSIVWNLITAIDSGPVSRVIRGEKALLLASALGQLADDYRRVIELRFLDGRKLKEIADEMDSSVGRVAGLLRRGLDELHQLLPNHLKEEMEGTDP